MRLAIDFDDTYTRSPALWDAFLRIAREDGHIVWCVTVHKARQMEEVHASIGQIIGIDNCMPPESFPSADHLDTYVDTWIEDAPEMIVDMPLLGGLTDVDPDMMAS